MIAEERKIEHILVNDYPFLKFLIIVPIAGIIFDPKLTFVLTFLITLFWILKGKKEILGGLDLLWMVRVEPAPSDLLFAWTWFKKFIGGEVRWMAYTSSNFLLAFVVLNLFQIIIVKSLERGIFFAAVTVYTISLSFLFSVMENRRTWKEIKDHYLIAVWIAAFVIIVLALLKLVGLNGHVSELYKAGRPRGFFKDPNVAGPFIVTGALYSLSRILFLKKSILGKTGIAFLLSSLAVLLTFSRGALLNFAVGVLVIGIIAFLRGRGWKFTFVILLILGVSILFLPRVVEAYGQTERFKSVAFYDIYGRFAAWRAGILLAKDYPFGIGPGQFEIYSPEYQVMISRLVIITPSAHSLYIRVLAENGFLGLSILLIAFAMLWNELRKSIKVSAKDFEMLADGVWILGSILGILAQSFVIDTLHWRHFWILVGFALAYRRMVETKG